MLSRCALGSNSDDMHTSHSCVSDTQEDDNAGDVVDIRMNVLTGDLDPFLYLRNSDGSNLIENDEMVVHASLICPNYELIVIDFFGLAK